MDRFREIFRSAEHKRSLWLIAISGLLLAIALKTGYTNLLEFLFNLAVSISYWETIFFIPIFTLLVNVAGDLKLNPLVIDLCVFFSKFLVKSIYAFVGFCTAMLLANLIFGQINNIAFFAIVGFTSYLVAIAVHWIILDLDSQSRDLCTETYC
ncbi:hypothetical protein [Acinetobacter sp. NIPH 298]|uniref:hypothetical protein n=1 Tax=Acinetobacter sp. NIPH 298 TaxID=1217692 RepID=UPI000551D8EC|nr:hypothetical protein [Acinetobacter sp. NIPH 298]